MGKNERYIPVSIKNDIRIKQGNKCACCLKTIEEFHHVNPVAREGKNFGSNIVGLCKHHHKNIHLGDLDTILSLYEYIYYKMFGKPCSDPINDLQEIIKIIKNDT